MEKRERNPWVVWFAVGLGSFMGALNNNIIGVSLPTMSREFGVGPEVIQWVVTIYFLTTVTCLVIFGRLSDLLGKREVYLTGYLCFLLGTALTGLSTSLWQAILFRILQAIGGAMLVSNSMAIVATVFPRERRGAAMGMNGTLVGAGNLLGPTLGGILTGSLGWRFVFWANLPVGIIALILGIILIPKTPRAPGRVEFDFSGAALYAGAMISLLVGINSLKNASSYWGWLGPILLGVILGTTFLKQEARVKKPMLDLKLFANPDFSVGIGSSFLSHVAVAFSNFTIPFYLESVLQLEPARVGMLMTPLPVATITLSGISGWLADRMDRKVLTVIGMGFMIIASFWLFTLNKDSTPFQVSLRLLFLGIGTGIFNTPNNYVVLNSAPDSRVALASSLLATTRHSGFMMGTLSSATLLAVYGGSALAAAGASAAREGLADGVRAVFFTATLIAVAGFILCVSRIRLSRSRDIGHAGPL